MWRKFLIDIAHRQNERRGASICLRDRRALPSVPAIDIGQIDRRLLLQGMARLTDELVFDEQGRLLAHAPSTYEIPFASDVPGGFPSGFVRRQ